MRSLPEKPHALSEYEFIKAYQTDTKSGLTTNEALSRQQKYGKNELPEGKKINLWLLFLHQLQNILIYILLVAAIISFITDHAIDGYVILVVIFINALIGFIQEFRAEKSIQALQSLVVHKARVIRSDEQQLIPQTELTVGDLIRIEEGDYIPADARILEAFELKTMEASLTGESQAATKKEGQLAASTALGDRNNMIWMGTYASSGSCQAVVTGVGLETQLGQIAKSLDTKEPENLHYKELTEKLVRVVGGITICLAIIIFLYGYFIRRQELFEIFLFSLATLVSGIPEGLPAVLAIVLAIGAQRMAKRQAVIRSLPTIETLGAVTTICTDKTGTLTENVMQVMEYHDTQGFGYQIAGKGWDLEGQIISLKNSQPISFITGLVATKSHSTSLQQDQTGKVKVVGEPTEAALEVFAQKIALQEDYEYDQFEVVSELPFSSDNKFRGSVVLDKKTEKYYLLAIGAPEVLLERSEKHGSKIQTIADKKIKSKIQQHVQTQSSKGFRTLGLAFLEIKFTDNLHKPKPQDFQDLVFLGVASIQDPLRSEAIKAIKIAHQAGIRVVMMTGDHKDTAKSIALQAGLLNDTKKTDFPEVLSDLDLQELNDKDFAKAVKEVNVFARLSPQTKMKITQTLQTQGHIVAMTGDGVNDAPALKKADVGIAMGINGTDVSREASDMILMDDNFASIVKAISEGRTVFENIKRSSYYLLSTNFGESLTILLALFLGLPAPLTATQILWINLVTDSINGIALATEKTHNEMASPPRPQNARILTFSVIPFILIISGLMATIALSGFPRYASTDLSTARTVVYAAIVLPQLFNLFALRDLKVSVLTRDFFGNKAINIAFVLSLSVFLAAIYLPIFRPILGFSPLPMWLLGVLILASSMGLWMVEVYKFAKARLNPKHE
jgi:Ca2+-transporting ATPase